MLIFCRLQVATSTDREASGYLWVAPPDPFFTHLHPSLSPKTSTLRICTNSLPCPLALASNLASRRHLPKIGQWGQHFYSSNNLPTRSSQIGSDPLPKDTISIGQPSQPSTNCSHTSSLTTPTFPGSGVLHLGYPKLTNIGSKIFPTWEKNATH